MTSKSGLLLAGALLAVVAASSSAQDSDAAKKPGSPQSLAQRTAGMQHQDGLMPLDWDAKTGKLYLEISHPNTELLYTDSLPYGTGSNDLGLDRGQTAPARVVRFERQGPKVLLVERNERFRTSAHEAAELL